MASFCACLVGAVEQGEDIPFLHGDLSRALLLIVVERQDQLLPSLVIHGGHLLLKIQRKGKQSYRMSPVWHLSPQGTPTSTAVPN